MGDPAITLPDQMGSGSISAFVIIDHYAGNAQFLVYTVKKYQGDASFADIYEMGIVGGLLGDGDQDAIHTRS